MPWSRARRAKRKKGKVKRMIKKRKKTEKKREEKMKRKTRPDMQNPRNASNTHPITQTTTSLPLRLDPIAFTVRCDDLET
jgi:hypothetical protein